MIIHKIYSYTALNDLKRFFKCQMEKAGNQAYIVVKAHPGTGGRIYMCVRERKHT